MKTIDRLAMDLAGKSEVSAEKTLRRFGFSPAEIGEIVSSNTRMGTLPPVSTMTSDWMAIAITIEASIRCSIRLNDRFNMHI